ncbi:TetR family transcriptional regulator [Peribacillus kribbensis]|uniref:TetR family transcriptional regulator n=1 Tax=Peribacillus kribbensis TaxID=356658 RepID=UPI001FE16FCD|nr:TetR family transcriptional regulator [Peribacillus kribbensis]
MSEEYKEKRKEEILETAREIFIKQGFEKTTMTDIVEATGLSRGGVYQYFSSTDEMFRHITDRNDQESKKWFLSLIENSSTAWEAVEKLLQETEQDRLSDGIGFGVVQFEYFLNSLRVEERASYLMKRFQFLREYFSKLIQNGVETGEFKPLQPIDAIILFIMNVSDGLLLYRLMSFNRLGPKEVYVSEQVEALRMYLKAVLQVEQ